MIKDKIKVVIWDLDDTLWKGMVLCQDLVQVKMRNFSPF